MQTEALAAGDSGDHARRSIIRKVYLYLALFVSVVGGMIVAVSLLNMLLRSLFGGSVDNLLQQALKDIEVLFLFVGLGVYHGLLLRQDGKRAAEALAEKHAAFPVLVFEPGDGSFGQTILAALHKQTPRLPVVIQAAGQPVPQEITPGAVLLPSDLAVDPPELLRAWLDNYHGNRLIVPVAGPEHLEAGRTPGSLPAECAPSRWRPPRPPRWSANWPRDRRSASRPAPPAGWWSFISSPASWDWNCWVRWSPSEFRCWVAKKQYLRQNSSNDLSTVTTPPHKGIVKRKGKRFENRLAFQVKQE